MIVDATVQKAYQVALEGRLKAHAPYSNFLVGAALKLSDSDEIIPGCNVENASYGGTVCAERTSIFTAVANGHKKYDFIVIVTDTDPASPPCGFCRQVMSEFCDESFPVYMANLNEIQKKYTLGELLPEMFDKTHL